MDRVDCLVFEDQMDARMRGALPPEAAEQMRAHAARCPQCAALARLGERLAGPSLEELEARVPDAWVVDMWSDVRRKLRARDGVGRSGRGWAVPVLAAASVALLLLNGVTLRALGRATAVAEDLTEQVLDQQRRLIQAGEPPTESGGDALRGRAASLRALEAEGDLTVESLRALLAGLPPETPVIRASRVEALAGSRLLPLTWKRALARLPTAGDVTAGDVLGVLDELELPGGTAVPAGRLFDLLS